MSPCWEECPRAHTQTTMGNLPWKSRCAGQVRGWLWHLRGTGRPQASALGVRLSVAVLACVHDPGFFRALMASC